MKKILSVLIMCAFVTAVIGGCAKKPSADDKVLARVSGKFITLKQFKSRLAKMPAYYQSVVEKNKKRYLDEMVVETMFYEEAIRRGIGNDRDVREVIDEAKKKILIAKLIKNEVEDKVKVSDEEMKQFYEANKDRFKTPALWRASHVLLATEKDAESVLDELAKGASFEELAKARSLDATASRGGDIGYFRAGQVVPDFESVCLKLNVGETSGVVHTQFGYHVIRLTDRKEPAVKSYDEAKRFIESELKRKKRSELFDKLVADLKTKYGAKIEEDVFKSLDSVKKENKPDAK